MNSGRGISYKIALRWMPLDLTDDKSTLVQVMAWCHQATSHYLSQCWPRSLPPYDFTRPQWVNFLVLKLECFKRTRSILLLLMPWLLASPGHQQPCHWMCRITRSSSSLTHWPLGNLNFSDWQLRYLLWNCLQKNEYHWMRSHIGSGNGLVPLGNKPLPEPMLTQFYVTIWHQ